MVGLGLDSYSYHLHLEDLDHPRDAFWFLGKTLDLGLSGCSINPRHLRGWDEQLVRGIGRYCRANGLRLELGCGGSDCGRMSKRLMLAANVGAAVLHTFISGERYKVPDEQRQENIASTTENLKRLGEIAECVGVVVAIRNNEDLTSSEIVSILRAVDSPFVRAVGCGANALSVWEDPLDAIRTLSPFLAGVRLKDWTHWWEDGIPVREGCILGNGHARIADVYSFLRQSNPEVPITLEIPTIGPGFSAHTLEEEEANVLSSLAFARSLENPPILK